MITSAYTDAEPISSFLEAYQKDSCLNHTVVNDPKDADLILFIENSRYHSDFFFTRLKKHLLVKEFPQKVFMYNPHDKPWYVLPGLYTSMPIKRFNESYMSAVPYIESINPYIHCDFSVNPKFLFSFIGSPNSPVRRQLFHLSCQRGMIHNTGYMFGKHGDSSRETYAESLTNSKFILAPKGAGTSSFRLFETMQAGRVPVIISDSWVPPSGPNWSEFALFIPENKVRIIPDLLKEEELNWDLKARSARRNWEIYFGPDKIFNYFIDCIVDLKSKMSQSNHLSMVKHHLALVEHGFRSLVIQNLKRILN